MKKTISLLLSALMIIGITAYAGVALAQKQEDNFRPAAMYDNEEFVQMTPQEQYDYLTTLGSEDEIQQAMSLLDGEQLAALEAYRLSVETQPPESTATDGQSPAEETGQSGADTTPTAVDYSAMTPQELYEYLLTSESEGEAEVVLSMLSPEQRTALEAYTLSIAETAAPPAVNYTSAAPFLDPVDIPVPTMARQFAANALNAPEEENALVLGKTVSSLNGSYMLTIEAYATGEVTITTGDPLPTDIILVLDVSGSMNAKMTDNAKCIEALKAAVNNFIDTVAGKATLAMNHRIAVVTFASASSIISGDGSASGAFVGAYNNASGISTLKNTINDLKAGSSQGADSGLNKAISIFDSAPATGTRNRVVIYLAGGTPNGVDLNPAIGYAHTLKADCGATVYSVGVFDGADPTIPLSTAKDDNKYMHFVSSNYPNAEGMINHGEGSNAGYYLSASNSAALNDIFKSIATRIGGTTVTLDETSVIKDMIAPYFRLPAGAVPSSIHCYTSEVDGDTGAWLARQPFGGTVTISTDRKTIGISGFDYAENYYAEIKTDGVITGYQGKKLIIEIPIEYIPGSCFGGTVPTNQPVSGVYDEDFLVEALPIPKVDIPVQYDFTPLNQPIYLTQAGMINGLFTSASGYVADGVNNAYVSIAYTVKSPGGTPIGVYAIPAGQTAGTWDISSFELEGLTANATFTVSCTVTPVGAPLDPTKVFPVTVNKTPTVYVWTPEVTWRDSIIYLGETANYNNNLALISWKNLSTSAPTPAGAAPVLQYQFTPGAAAFTADTHVSVVVKIASIDVTPHTSFIHETCSFPGCGFNPASGQFMVHVKTCSLTITKTGAADPTDTFLFTVTGGGLTLRVSVQGNGSTTIVGLPVGTYTIAENDEWSWRYTAPDGHATLDASHPSASVTISNNLTNDHWLSGDSHAVNTFPGVG